MSDGEIKSGREGSLEAPTRHALGWQEPEFYDAGALQKELERVFEICHGCRRCFNLCNSFPTLFDLIDQSKTGELDGVDKKAFGQVVDQCYLCDMCYMTKCPYVPPHPWNVDFPHLMLRAKAVKNRSGGLGWRDKVLSSTDMVGKLAGIPVVAEVVNAVNRSSLGRKALDAALGVHPKAPVPCYRSDTLRKQLAKRRKPIERCSGHNGTYGIKREFRDASMKIGKPVFQRVQASGADFYASDCPMAGQQIESGLENAPPPTHPLTLLRMAYGLELK